MVYFFLLSILNNTCSGFVNEENVKDYAQNRERYANPKRKGSAFADAVKKIDEFLRDPVVRYTLDIFISYSAIKFY